MPESCIVPPTAGEFTRADMPITARRMALAGGLAVALLTSAVQAFEPTPPQNMSPAPWVQQAQTTCMACTEKCKKCAGGQGAGTTPGYVYEVCLRDCAQAGNPMVNATCGIRQRC
jgi:hypothetical protein